MLRLKAAAFLRETSQCILNTQQRGSPEKSGLRDAKRADFVRYWRRSGKKIRIYRGLLYTVVTSLLKLTIHFAGNMMKSSCSIVASAL